MKTLLVILVTGLQGQPVFVLVGVYPDEAACAREGAVIVALTLQASSPAGVDFLCLTEAVS